MSVRNGRRVPQTLTATDPMARETARTAHTRITETTADLKARIALLETTLARRAGFVARCSLCGTPCRPNRRYCHAHSWAEGQKD